MPICASCVRRDRRAVDHVPSAPRSASFTVRRSALATTQEIASAEQKAAGADYPFGGVRTFPLVGLIGYATALLAGDAFLPVALGLAVVAAFLLVFTLTSCSPPALRVSLGNLRADDLPCGRPGRSGPILIATTLSVALFLLELKAALEGLRSGSRPTRF